MSVRHLLPHFSPQSPEEGYLQTCSYQLMSEKLPKGKDWHSWEVLWQSWWQIHHLLECKFKHRHCHQRQIQHLSLFFPITWENCKMRESVLQKWHEWTSFENYTTFSSVQSCLTLCDPMDCSTPGFPIHHQLPEGAQTHAHQVNDAIYLLSIY